MKRLTLWVLYSAALLACGALVASAESFSGSLIVRPQWTHTKTTATTASESFSTLYNFIFTSGTNSFQMDQIWTSQRTLTNSANETINIAGGITNSFGTVLTMAEVRLISVKSASANVDSITIGGAAANTFASWLGDTSDTITIRPGGYLLAIAPDATGYAVSTNGNIKVTNNGTNSVTYDIYIGASSE